MDVLTPSATIHKLKMAAPRGAASPRKHRRAVRALRRQAGTAVGVGAAR